MASDGARYRRKKNHWPMVVAHGQEVARRASGFPSAPASAMILAPHPSRERWVQSTVTDQLWLESDFIAPGRALPNSRGMIGEKQLRKRTQPPLSITTAAAPASMRTAICVRCRQNGLPAC